MLSFFLCQLPDCIDIGIQKNQISIKGRVDKFHPGQPVLNPVAYKHTGAT